MWRYRTWIGGGFLLLVVVVMSVWLRFRPEPIPADNQPYQAIEVGKTTQQQLIDQVGSPYSEYDKDGYRVVSQKSSKSPYRPDLFYIKDSTVVLKEQWYEPSVYYVAEADFLQPYGQPEAVMYVSPANDVVVKANLYPRRGLAVYVQEEAKAVWYVRYFAPMSLDEYLRYWGKNLSKDRPEHLLRVEPKD